MAPPYPRRPLRALGVIATVLLGLVAVAGCSDDKASPNSAPVEERGDTGGDALNGAPQPGAEPPTKDGDSYSAPLTSVDQRSIIYTGTINVQVESVVPAADRAIAIAVGLGGIVAGDTRHLGDDGSQATLVLRVPADRFNSTLDSLAGLGTEQGRQVTSQDVTEAIVDLDARIAAQQASVDRVRALLAQAQNIGEIVSIEGELTRRQADLDSLKQRRATMSGLVELATITVVLYGPAGPVVTTENQTGFLAGLRKGWHGFLASVAGVVTVTGYLLPWAIAIGVPLLVVLWIVRRRRRSAAA